MEGQFHVAEHISVFDFVRVDELPVCVFKAALKTETSPEKYEDDYQQQRDEADTDSKPYKARPLNPARGLSDDELGLSGVEQTLAEVARRDIHKVLTDVLFRLSVLPAIIQHQSKFIQRHIAPLRGHEVLLGTTHQIVEAQFLLTGRLVYLGDAVGCGRLVVMCILFIVEPSESFERSVRLTIVTKQLRLHPSCVEGCGVNSKIASSGLCHEFLIALGFNRPRTGIRGKFSVEHYTTAEPVQQERTSFHCGSVGVEKHPLGKGVLVLVQENADLGHTREQFLTVVGGKLFHQALVAERCVAAIVIAAQVDFTRNLPSERVSRGSHEHLPKHSYALLHGITVLVLSRNRSIKPLQPRAIPSARDHQQRNHQRLQYQFHRVIKFLRFSESISLHGTHIK